MHDKVGQPHDVLYARVEPDRADAASSHLGKTVVRPYKVVGTNPGGLSLVPYTDALELPGEDPSLTRIYRRRANGKPEAAWLLSCVVPVPKVDKPNEVASLRTHFYVGTSLGTLELIAVGPEGMKDIRIAAPLPDSLLLDNYGRPQPVAFSGNISYSQLPSVDGLSEATVATEFIDPDLCPIGSGTWIGANDVVPEGPYKNLLVSHQGVCIGEDGHGRQYDGVMHRHNKLTGTIENLGVFATAGQFPAGPAKQDETVDLRKVVFPGGARNGHLPGWMTFGVRDCSIGIAYVRACR